MCNPLQDPLSTCILIPSPAPLSSSIFSMGLIGSCGHVCSAELSTFDASWHNKIPFQVVRELEMELGAALAEL